MKILLATWGTRLVGGAETYIGRIAGLLRAAGCDVALFAEMDGPADRALIPLPPGSPRLLASESGDRVAAARAWKPDVVFAHGFLDPAIEAALLDVAPAVFFAHNYYGTCVSGEKTHKAPHVRPCGRTLGPACLGLYYPRRCGGLSPATMIADYRKQRARRALLERYAAVITASRHMQDELTRHGAAGGRVAVCPFPRPAAAPTTAPSSMTPKDPSSPWRLTFLGRMDRLKGGAELLDALPYVARTVATPVHLTMAGDGPRRAEWKAQAQRIQAAASTVRVMFPGWLRGDQVSELYAATDLLIVPSVWPEPFGLVGLEANSHGVPVVAYAVGGIPEWLSDGVNGCLAPGDPPTIDGLADAIVRAMRVMLFGPSLREGARRAAASAPTEAAHGKAVLTILEGAVRPGSAQRADDRTTDTMPRARRAGGRT